MEEELIITSEILLTIWVVQTLLRGWIGESMEKKMRDESDDDGTQ